MYPKAFNGITFLDVYIHEPGGLITDSAIAFLCLYLCWKVGRPRDSFQKYWLLFIAFVGLGGLGGALVHGFPTVLGEELFYWMWVLKNIFLPAANLSASYIVLVTVFPEKGKQLKVALWAKFFLANVLMAYTYSFLPIVVDLAITYVLLIYFCFKLKEKIKPYSKIFYAFIVAFLSGFLFIIKYDIDPIWFSHKDMVHVFALWSMILVYQGIRIGGKPYKAAS